MSVNSPETPTSPSDENWTAPPATADHKRKLPRWAKIITPIAAVAIAAAGVGIIVAGEGGGKKSASAGTTGETSSQPNAAAFATKFATDALRGDDAHTYPEFLAFGSHQVDPARWKIYANLLSLDLTGTPVLANKTEIGALPNQEGTTDVAVFTGLVAASGERAEVDEQVTFHDGAWFVADFNQWALDAAGQKIASSESGSGKNI